MKLFFTPPSSQEEKLVQTKNLLPFCKNRLTLLFVSSSATITSSAAHTAYLTLHSQLSELLKGQEKNLHYILSCYFTGHHVLLEDFPGTGKTTLAKELGRHLDATETKRVQFTPDLLPSDLTGVNIFNPADRAFTFQKGPIFCNILLADEINRSSPRTQSALLEAMAEHQVTIEGTTYPLPNNFFVIATQNPIEFKGTYQLPEAQLDRFGVQCSLGYLPFEDELAILEVSLESSTLSPTRLSPLSEASQEEIAVAISKVHITSELKNYIVNLVSATRNDPEVKLPLSPRATITLAKLSQAYAFALGKEFVTAEIIQELAPITLSHRIMLTSPSQNNTTGKLSYISTLISNTAIN